MNTHVHTHAHTHKKTHTHTHTHVHVHVLYYSAIISGNFTEIISRFCMQRWLVWSSFLTNVVLQKVKLGSRGILPRHLALVARQIPVSRQPTWEHRPPTPAGGESDGFIPPLCTPTPQFSEPHEFLLGWRSSFTGIQKKERATCKTGNTPQSILSVRLLPSLLWFELYTSPYSLSFIEWHFKGHSVQSKAAREGIISSQGLRSILALLCTVLQSNLL